MNANNIKRTRYVLIWGGGSAARLVESHLLDLHPQIKIIIYDSTITRTHFETNSLFINSVDKLNRFLPDVSEYVIAIGAEHGYARYKISEHLKRLNIKPIKIISKSAYIDHTVNIGKGCQIMNSVTINKFVSIGEQCIINTGATIDHECRLGNGVHIMGSAAIAGRVIIGDFSTVGTNATILPDIKIGTRSYVGAGAVVLKDVPNDSVVIGNPAIELRRNIIVFNEKDLLCLRTPVRFGHDPI